jgi:hypothetical protein
MTSETKNEGNIIANSSATAQTRCLQRCNIPRRYLPLLSIIFECRHNKKFFENVSEFDYPAARNSAIRRILLAPSQP